jgi:hypothetical protein
MNSSIDKIDHMPCRLNGQGMMGEAWPRRDVGCHFTSKVQLPIGPFCEQHNHQVLQRDHANTKLNKLGVRQRRNLGLVNES